MYAPLRLWHAPGGDAPARAGWELIIEQPSILEESARSVAETVAMIQRASLAMEPMSQWYRETERQLSQLRRAYQDVPGLATLIEDWGKQNATFLEKIRRILSTPENGGARRIRRLASAASITVATLQELEHDQGAAPESPAESTAEVRRFANHVRQEAKAHEPRQGSTDRVAELLKEAELVGEREEVQSRLKIKVMGTLYDQFTEEHRKGETPNPFSFVDENWPSGLPLTRHDMRMFTFTVSALVSKEPAEAASEKAAPARKTPKRTNINWKRAKHAYMEDLAEYGPKKARTKPSTWAQRWVNYHGLPEHEAKKLAQTLRREHRKWIGDHPEISE